ncbi:hypothetical protein HYT60_02375 [Candidatus Woesebacteria bacterium]|nr:hypothetical protein [Candidatus Woesebacteria bacterium]
MAERILEIEVPKSILDAIKEPFEEGNAAVRAIAKEEVNRVIEALRLQGVIQEENDISVTLQGNPDLSPDSLKRRVKVTQIFREDDDRKGAIDSHTETYLVEIPSNPHN